MSGELLGYDRLKARLAAVSTPQARRDVMRAVGEAAVGEAKLRVPRKSSNLGRTIRATDVNEKSVRVIAGAKYARWVEEGTGLYGPQHQRITPVAKKAMRWMGGPASAFRLSGSVRSGKAGADARAIFARSTKGMEAKPFLLPGAKAALTKAGLLSDVIVELWNEAAE